MTSSSRPGESGAAEAERGEQAQEAAAAGAALGAAEVVAQDLGDLRGGVHVARTPTPTGGAGYVRGARAAAG